MYASAVLSILAFYGLSRVLGSNAYTACVALGRLKDWFRSTVLHVVAPSAWGRYIGFARLWTWGRPYRQTERSMRRECMLPVYSVQCC